MVCIIAAVLVLCVAIPVGVLGLAGRLKAITPSPSPNVSIPASITPSPGQDGATNWAIGRELAVGDLAVTITSVEFVSQVGDDKGVSENGQFAIINLTVEYTGEDEGNFSPEFQFLRTEPAGYYRDDAEAALMYQPTTLGSEPLQPGRPRIGCLAFDIPLGFKPIALELVDQVGGDPLVVPLG
ncbi:MAG: DUF4352 domain-containing protein [Bifidobacteriaceae bacterium]|nr:DUF4352 domain-containing protein [Bifidobacteriaceae bacterium]